MIRKVLIDKWIGEDAFSVSVGLQIVIGLSLTHPFYRIYLGPFEIEWYAGRQQRRKGR